ncbi:hypothetical protein DFH08DRAFT_949495 [Mycena albidolilacea]|uniref:Uncharacterized protein n=1 Tax=Mycena albidolilacea TaxID=1033008 RepID=A0AAD7F1R5_9AGAR|nr:hypothetical protein DFH08DRAFT_949495 [Mycena albidolilacea]
MTSSRGSLPELLWNVAGTHPERRDYPALPAKRAQPTAGVRLQYIGEHPTLPAAHRTPFPIPFGMQDTHRPAPADTPVVPARTFYFPQEQDSKELSPGRGVAGAAISPPQILAAQVETPPQTTRAPGPVDPMRARLPVLARRLRLTRHRYTAGPKTRVVRVCVVGGRKSPDGDLSPRRSDRATPSARGARALFFHHHHHLRTTASIAVVWASTSSHLLSPDDHDLGHPEAPRASKNNQVRGATPSDRRCPSTLLRSHAPVGSTPMLADLTSTLRWTRRHARALGPADSTPSPATSRQHPLCLRYRAGGANSSANTSLQSVNAPRCQCARRAILRRTSHRKRVRAHSAIPKRGRHRSCPLVHRAARSPYATRDTPMGQLARCARAGWILLQHGAPPSISPMAWPGLLTSARSLFVLGASARAFASSACVPGSCATEWGALPACLAATSTRARALPWYRRCAYTYSGAVPTAEEGAAFQRATVGSCVRVPDAALLAAALVRAQASFAPRTQHRSFSVSAAASCFGAETSHLAQTLLTPLMLLASLKLLRPLRHLLALSPSQPPRLSIHAAPASPLALATAHLDLTSHLRPSLRLPPRQARTGTNATRAASVCVDADSHGCDMSGERAFLVERGSSASSHHPSRGPSHATCPQAPACICTFVCTSACPRACAAACAGARLCPLTPCAAGVHAELAVRPHLCYIVQRQHLSWALPPLAVRLRVQVHASTPTGRCCRSHLCPNASHAASATREFTLALGARVHLGAGDGAPHLVASGAPTQAARRTAPWISPATLHAQNDYAEFTSAAGSPTNNIDLSCQRQRSSPPKPEKAQRILPIQLRPDSRGAAPSSPAISPLPRSVKVLRCRGARRPPRFAAAPALNSQLRRSVDCIRPGAVCTAEEGAASQRATVPSTYRSRGRRSSCLAIARAFAPFARVLRGHTTPEHVLAGEPTRTTLSLTGGRHLRYRLGGSPTPSTGVSPRPFPMYYDTDVPLFMPCVRTTRHRPRLTSATARGLAHRPRSPAPTLGAFHSSRPLATPRCSHAAATLEPRVCLSYCSPNQRHPRPAFSACASSRYTPVLVPGVIHRYEPTRGSALTCPLARHIQGASTSSARLARPQPRLVALRKAPRCQCAHGAGSSARTPSTPSRRAAYGPHLREMEAAVGTALVGRAAKLSSKSGAPLSAHCELCPATARKHPALPVCAQGCSLCVQGCSLLALARALDPSRVHSQRAVFGSNALWPPDSCGFAIVHASTSDA